MSRIAVSALLAALLAMGTACGSDDPNADPSPATSSPPSSPATSPTEPTDPTDTATSSVAPATGPLLDVPHASVHAPEGWHVRDQLMRGQKDAGDDDTSSGISLGEIVSYQDELSADQVADIWYQVSPYPMKPKRLPNTELDGVEVYHIAGNVQKLLYLEEFGAQVDGKLVGLTFTFSDEVSPDERQEIVDSVIATFEWT